MLLSRIWYFILAAAFAVVSAALFMAQAAMNHRQAENVEDRLRRDQFEVELWMMLDDELRADALVALASNPALQSPIRQAAEKTAESLKIDASTRTRLEDKMRNASSEQSKRAQRADLLALVDRSGHILAQVGESAVPLDASLVESEAFQRGLKGFMGKDLWFHQGQIYAVALAPLLDAKNQVITLALWGTKIDASYVEELGRRLPGGHLFFFAQGKLVGSAESAALSPALVSRLPAQIAKLKERPEIREGRPMSPQELGEGWRWSAASLGSRKGAQGYVLLRPYDLLSSPWSLIEETSAEDRQAVMTPIAIAAGVALLLAVLGLVFLRMEYEMPLRRLRGDLRAMGDGARGELDIAAYPRRFRDLADLFNHALIALVTAKSRNRSSAPPADLNAILGPTPDELPDRREPSFAFPTADEEDAAEASVPSFVPAFSSRRLAAAPSPAVETREPAQLPPAPPPVPRTNATRRQAPALPVTAPRKGATAGGLPANGAQAKRTRAAAAAPAFAQSDAFDESSLNSQTFADAFSTTLRGENIPDGSQPISLSDDSGAKAIDSGLLSFSSIPPSDDWDEQEGATLVAQVPKDLLAATLKPNEDAKREEEEDRQHFLQVFAEYLETRKRCGESISGVTFEKFQATLQKNLMQIKSRHGATRVRFKVYVKAGKAALKATPYRSRTR